MVFEVDKKTESFGLCYAFSLWEKPLFIICREYFQNDNILNISNYFLIAQNAQCV